MDKKLAEIKNLYNNADEQKLIEQAFVFARSAHRGQKRKTGEDYLIHPLTVACTLSRLQLDARTIAAGLLHDVLENTKITAVDVTKEFDQEIAFLVEGVSKLRGVDFKGEKELAENFRKMILATAQDIRVVLIKLADVLHNTQTLGTLSPSRKKRYAREVLEIYAPIANRLGIGWLKGELEDLAFPYVMPKEYNELSSLVKDAIKENEQYIEDLKPKVFKLLEKEEIKPIKIDARTKHLYSLWKKTKRLDKKPWEIYDLVALRIIVSDIPTCYATLGALHKRWRPLPNEIKDYIALPKPNGYQSLHTKVFGEGGKITEFQIRSQEMHNEAEFGIAAHWAYKEKITHPFKKKLSWIKQLQDWQVAADPKEFLESLKIDFFRDRIFIFTPNGDVIDLPEGATPIDFAYAIHSDLGDQCVMAKVNGKPIQIASALKNNDIVEIITQKNKKPSPDWLGFVKTSKARSKIREALRKQELIK